MPAWPSEEPLRKVTLNLFAADIAYLKSVDEVGWTSMIRMIVREYIEKRKERYNATQN